MVIADNRFSYFINNHIFLICKSTEARPHCGWQAQRSCAGGGLFIETLTGCSRSFFSALFLKYQKPQGKMSQLCDTMKMGRSKRVFEVKIT